MSNNRTFRIALGISFAAHTLLFTQGAWLLHTASVRKPPEKPLEVTYVKAPPKSQAVPPQMRQALLPDQHAPQNHSPFTPKAEKTLFRPHTLEHSDRTISIPKPLSGPKDPITIKKKITIPALENPPVNNPSYIKYYQLVREQIKRAAYRAYAGREKGEVSVTFVVLAQGTLDSIGINMEKSSRSDYLRSIAQRSIREAAPFPAFSDELKEYSRLSFNVSITFESD